MFCPNCGSPATDGSSACSICGSVFPVFEKPDMNLGEDAAASESYIASNKDQVSSYIASGQSAKALLCPSCGQPSLIIRPDREFADCSICGSVVDVRNKEVTVEHHEHVVNNITYKSLGDRFVFSGGNSVLEGMTAAATSESGILDIPKGQGITVIGDGFCFGNQNITELVVPEGVRRIGASAFCNCSALKKVSLPASLKSVDSSAFENCSSLTEIEIPSGVRLGENVFRGCTGLRKVSIGSGVVGGTGSFIACSSLEQAELGQNTNVADSMFANCASLRVVKMSEGALVVDEYGFCDCVALNDVRLPSTLRKIGGAAFRGCTALTRIGLGQSISSLGTNAFEECVNLEGISVPEGATLGDGVFLNCVRLSRVELPSDLQVIPPSAFEGCRLLQYINVPNGLSSIGSAAFKDCECLGEFVLPVSVTRVPKRTFENCKLLVTAFDHPMDIGNSAFKGCRCLNAAYSNGDVPPDALIGCSALETLQAPMRFFSTMESAPICQGAADLFNIRIPDFDQGRAIYLEPSLFGDRTIRLNGVELSWAPWIMQCRDIA